MRHRRHKPRFAGTSDIARGKIRVIHCPECDKSHKRQSKESYRDLLERVKKHVATFHPEHKSEWLKAYPEQKLT